MECSHKVEYKWRKTGDDVATQSIRYLKKVLVQLNADSSDGCNFLNDMSEVY